MDEPTAEPVKKDEHEGDVLLASRGRGLKKKRKYTKRGQYRITVEGKTFQGIEIRREGKFLVLKTMKGSVMVNVETARTPIEIIGEIAVQMLAAPVAANPNGAPVRSGHAAEVAAFRNREIEGLLKMPDFVEEGEDA